MLYSLWHLPVGRTSNLSLCLTVSREHHHIQIFSSQSDSKYYEYTFAPLFVDFYPGNIVIPVSRIESVKRLGASICTHLRWFGHMLDCIKRLGGLSFQIHSLRHFWESQTVISSLSFTGFSGLSDFRIRIHGSSGIIHLTVPNN